jgi:hypothetical protein
MFDQYKVSEEVQQERMKICSDCEHNVMGICKKCGCILHLKTQWAANECPIDKWGKNSRV